MNSVVLQRWKGNDWSFLFSVKNPDGSAVNLTGFALSARFYKAYISTPVAISGQMGSVTVPVPLNGQIAIQIDNLLTSTLIADTSKAAKFPNRLLLDWTDPEGNIQTLGLIRFQVFDYTSDIAIDETLPLTIVWQDASFVIQLAASQGPSGGTGSSDPTVTQVKIELAKVAGRFDTVEGGLPIVPLDPARLTWGSGGRVTLGGPLSNSIAATLGLDTAGMTSLLATAATNQT